MKGSSLMAISKTYDAIIPIGMSCVMATQLKKRGLRQASYPFDWLLFPKEDALETVVELIQTRFKGFLERNHLVVDSNKVITGRVSVCDTVLNITFLHDFFSPQLPDEELISNQAKYQRRIERFYHDISMGETVCLTLAIEKSQMDKHRLMEACRKLRKVFPKGELDFFVVVYEDEEEVFESLPLEKGTLYLKHLKRAKTMYDTQERVWEFCWLDEVGLTDRFKSKIQEGAIVCRKMTAWERLHYKIYRHNYKWLERRGLLRTQFDI